MKLELKRSPSSNNYCVPAALALITNLSVDEIESLLRVELGDQPITGLYYPLGLKILSKLGYQFKRIEPPNLGTKFAILSMNTYYCTNLNHCFVLHDSKFWDNHFPNGQQYGYNDSFMITQCWEVWKS